jgi:hypothetical protein
VVTFREPKGRTTAADWSPLVFAAPAEDLLAQYEALHAAPSPAQG